MSQKLNDSSVHLNIYSYRVTSVSVKYLYTFFAQADTQTDRQMHTTENSISFTISAGVQVETCR